MSVWVKFYTVENKRLCDKYRVSLDEHLKEPKGTVNNLNKFLDELKYYERV